MPTRRALLIGINYRGTSAELNGCINDVTVMRECLLQRGWKAEEITVITEDTDLKPTRDVLISSFLNLLLSGAEQLFFHYSGHGSWEQDLNSDEDDGRDESLVPLDYQTAGMITDDQLRGLLTFMRNRSKMTVLLDCCHSSSGLDLAFTLGTQAQIKRVRRGSRMARVKEMVPAMKKNNRAAYTPGQVVMLAGCLDVQYSADAYIEGRFQGAMTHCVLKAMDEKPGCTWKEFIMHIRKLLKDGGYEQIASLTSGQQLNLNDVANFL